MPLKLSPELLNLAAIEAERGRRSLERFIKLAWHQVEPGPYVHGWHIGAIAAHLEAVTRGEIRNLLINIPPRHMKSLSVSVFWPAWVWAGRPEFRFMFGSYDAELAIRDATQSRRLIQAPWYQERWGDVYRLAGDQNVKSRYQNDKGGHRIALGVGSGGTGDGGDCIVADDPLSAMQARSEQFLARARTWWGETMSSRLNDPKTGRRVIVMQRLHELDLSGVVLEQGDYVHLCLPTEYNPRLFLDIDGHRVKSYNPAPNPLGWTDPRKTAGELLWGDRFGPEEVAAAKRSLGSYGFAGQHQQTPSPGEGGRVKREWWQRYTTLPARFDELIQVWDLTFDDEGDSWCVGAALGRKGADRYIVDLVRAKLDFPAQLNAIRDFSAKHPKARTKVVEKKANGAAVIKSLRKQIPGLVGFNPEGNKEQRLAAVVPEIEAGNWWIPASAPWVNDFIEELAAFPAGATNDQVDVVSMGGIRFQGSTTGGGNFAKVKKARGSVHGR